MTQLKDFQLVTTIVLVSKKSENGDKTKYDTFNSHSKAETIINKSDIDDVFKSIYITIIPNIQKSLGKGLGYIIDFRVKSFSWKQLYQITKRIKP